MFEKRLNPNFEVEFKREENQIIAIHNGVKYPFDKETIDLTRISETIHIKPLILL